MSIKKYSPQLILIIFKIYYISHISYAFLECGTKESKPYPLLSSLLETLSCTNTHNIPDDELPLQYKNL
jgi:hypothetical protein